MKLNHPSTPSDSGHSTFCPASGPVTQNLSIFLLGRCLGCSVPSGEGSRRFAALGPGLRVRASSSSAGSLSLEALSRAAGTSAGGRRWSTQGFPQISSCRALSSPPVRGSQARTFSRWLSEAVHLSTQGPKGRRRVRFTIFIHFRHSAGRTSFLCLLFAPSSCTFSLVAAFDRIHERPVERRRVKNA